MVRCAECKQPVKQTQVRMAHLAAYLPPRPTFVNEPCGHYAGLLFDFIEEAP